MPSNLTSLNLRSTSSLRVHLCHHNTSLLHISPRNLTDVNRIAIEVLGDFFHGRVAGLDKEEVNNIYLETEEHAVDGVILPAQSIKSNAVDVLVEEERRGNTEVEPCETLARRP